MTAKQKKCIVLLSGGQDSTTCLFWAKKNFEDVTAIIFDYGQRHKVEIESAKKIAGLAGVSYIEQKITLFSDVQNSLLVKSDKEDVNNAVETEWKAFENWKHVDISQKHDRHSNLPASFVPGRNIFFLLTAAVIAEKKGIRSIVTGVCQTDYSGYPDCRRSVMDMIEDLALHGMEFGICIHTPLMHLSKKETVLLASKLPGCWEALKYSHTCYYGKVPPCGTCPSCLLRQKGFAEAGLSDPIYDR
jgi:7-cyano-7-deazaguanine synthase